MNTHHALLFIGSRDVCRAAVGIPAADPDVDVYELPQLAVSDARALAEKAARRPIAGQKRHFIVACERLTHEAQNALLKLFEDPPQTAQFYLIVPRESVLLPTLRSRLHLHFVEANGAAHTAADAFVKASYAERLSEIARLQKAKDTAAMRSIIEGVERIAAARTGMPLADVLCVSRYSDMRGASHKMLLEHLALSVSPSLR